MKPKREHDSLLEDEEVFTSELKRRRVVEELSPSPPPHPIVNPLAGLANYDDDEEEDDERQRRRAVQIETERKSIGNWLSKLAMEVINKLMTMMLIKMSKNTVKESEAGRLSTGGTVLILIL